MSRGPNGHQGTPLSYFKTLISGVRAALWLLAVAMSPLTAVAAPIMWNLQSVTFEDGATATGFLEWDAEAASGAQLSKFDVNVAGGNTVLFPAFEYTSFDSDPNGALASSSFIANFDGVIVPVTFVRLLSNNYFDGRPRELRLLFSPSLTDAGGIVPIYFPDPKFGTLLPGECFNCGPFRAIVAGQAVAIPEPETYAMMLAGLGILGFTARHRKKNAA